MTIYTIRMPGIEDFEEFAELMMETGARYHGKEPGGERRFVVEGPVSAGQVDALKGLAGYRNGDGNGQVEVSALPDDGEAWKPSSHAPEVVNDFADADDWWCRTVYGHPPR